MKIILNDIGKIRNANVDLNTITVIAGKNNSGKSTVGRILYSVYKGIKDEKDLGEKIISEYDSLVRFGADEGTIEVNGDIDCKISVTRDCETKFTTGDNKNINMVYLDDPNILDLPIDADFLKEVLTETRLDILEMIKTKSDNPITLNTIEEIVDGDLVIKDDHFYYTTHDNIKMQNTSSGLKMFLILKAILKNGWIKENTVFILDEPEVHLHPEWQLKLSSILVELSQKYHAKILLNTHSPYLVNAIEVYSALKEQDAQFYLTQNSENHSDIVKVTSELDLIYKELAEPFGLLEQIAYE